MSISSRENETGVFDYAVVGKGLMGSAAARYLSRTGARVAIIGPDEPADWSRHEGVFASHYDQGRITRRLSRDEVWASLAARAIEQYAYLEEASGIRFYYPTGGLYVAPHGSDDDYLAKAAAIGRQLGVAYEVYPGPAALAAAFPYLHFPEDCHALLELPPAGYINPRDLIRAQLTIAAAQGTTIFREVVTAVEVGSRDVRLSTPAGRTVRAGRILIAAGAFSNCFDLLPRPLALRVKSETTLLAEVTAEEAARLRRMPTLIYQIESPLIDSIYLLPPILYPDGRMYIKLGCNTFADQILPDLAAMRRWMVEGDSDAAAGAIQAALLSIIPGLAAASFTSKRCLVTYTPHGKPFIDSVVPGRVFVATGGNGASAKCSDTLGWLAAGLMATGAWPADFEAELFRVVFAGE